MLTSPSDNPAPVRDRNAARLQRQFAMFSRQIPALRRPLALIQTRGWWVLRLPIALLLIAGGILSILPFLGLWMLPVGLMLLAIDLPQLRGPLATTMIRLRRWYEVKRRKLRKRPNS